MWNAWLRGLGLDLSELVWRIDNLDNLWIGELRACDFNESIPFNASAWYHLYGRGLRGCTTPRSPRRVIGIPTPLHREGPREITTYPEQKYSEALETEGYVSYSIDFQVILHGTHKWVELSRPDLPESLVSWLPLHKYMTILVDFHYSSQATIIITVKA